MPKVLARSTKKRAAWPMKHWTIGVIGVVFCNTRFDCADDGTFSPFFPKGEGGCQAKADWDHCAEKKFVKIIFLQGKMFLL